MHYFCHLILSPKFLLTLFKPLAFICNMSNCTIRLFWWLCMLHDNDTSDFLMCFLFCGMCLILHCYYNAFYFASYIFCYYVNLFNQNLRLKCLYVFFLYIYFLYFFSYFSFNIPFSSFYLSNCLSLSEACFTRPLNSVLKKSST